MKNFYWILTFCFTLFGAVQAQELASNTRLTASQDTLRDDNNVLFFRFLDEYNYYRDDDKLMQVDKYLKKEEWEKAYDALYKYVMRFGIRNFYRDSFLIWRLGKLAEKLKYEDKAVQFYRLVLKHHPNGRDPQYRLYFDSLTRNDRDYYLPVEYYYTYANAASNIDTLEIPNNIYTDLGDSVNTYYNDYGPALTANDLILIYTSQRKQVRTGPRYKANEDLFYSRKADSLYITQTEEGSRIDTLPWTDSKPLPGGINTKYNEGSPCLSKDGKTMYFSRCESPDGFGNCDIYVTYQIDQNKWTIPVNLGLNVNSLSWDSQPALSHTEDTLFFASDRLGGFGQTDIWYTTKLDYDLVEGDTLWRWAPARNMGPIINTRGSEVSPFYHPRYQILYFSSNGQLVNFGGFDIFKSYRVNARWLEPVNVGPLVNYKKDEYYFTIDSRSENLYYAKKVRKKFYDFGVGDTVQRELLNLHTAAMPMEAQPEAYTVLKGIVTDSITGEAFDGIISIIDLDKGIEVAPKYLRPDGSYRFDLIRDNNYLLIITGEDFLRIEKEFLLKGDTTINFATPSIKFKKWKFEAIEFDESSSNIIDKMVPDLEKLIYFLADHPNLGLKISGHTDSQGDFQANMQLSQRRADAIRTYILDKGRFKENRIEAIGYGNTQPVVEEEQTDEDRRINRRVEFELFKYKR